MKPREENAPTVISLFAGCGGSSLGYSMAGFRELLAVEWDDNAVETFKLNFPDIPVYHGDIAKCSVDWILDTTGLKPGELDILDGSPPCQGFSTAGKRMIEDPRNSLFREYVRILQGLKPKVFVMENVSGMVKGKMKIVFSEIMRELKASGYKVSARLLNAMYFGVPQSRERMIFIGVREDLGIEPSHPVAEIIPITVFEAWGKLTNLDGNYFKYNPNSDTYYWISKCLPNKSCADIHPKGFYFNFRRLSFDRYSPTLIKNGGKQLIHPKLNRTLTYQEYKRIGSFPDSFIILGNIVDQTFRIGNSVPPLFMRSIAHFSHGWI